MPKNATPQGQMKRRKRSNIMVITIGTSGIQEIEQFLNNHP